MRSLALLFLIAFLLALLSRQGRADGVIGTKAPEWTATEWLNSEPLSLSQLHGKVLVVRWWTGSGCPYCAESAPSLNALWEKYRDQGLIVIGMYHHKDPEPLTREHVEGQVKRLGIRFPVAIDSDWKTLHLWWLDRQTAAAWTSVTFVIDRDGVVRHVHPGGSLVEGRPDFAELEKAVVAALGKK
jgi:peroxiredoxin